MELKGSQGEDDRQPAVICPSSDILKESIKKQNGGKMGGKITICMGYDGHSFFVSKSDGSRVTLNGIDGRTDAENAPLGFMEWAWGAQLCPVVIVYSDNDNTNSKLKLSSRLWTEIPRKTT